MLHWEALDTAKTNVAKMTTRERERAFAEPAAASLQTQVGAEQVKDLHARRGPEIETRLLRIARFVSIWFIHWECATWCHLHPLKLMILDTCQSACQVKGRTVQLLNCSLLWWDHASIYTSWQSSSKQQWMCRIQMSIKDFLNEEEDCMLHACHVSPTRHCVLYVPFCEFRCTCVII